jgi:arylsulfatase A-like enzyme
MLQTGPVPDRKYPRLPPRYQASIERADGCFGEFLAGLRKLGLYDESLIVFTADHGDNAGDIGRMGHGLYLAPSEIKVPLIIHLPRSLRSQTVTDTERVAFVSDITPTITYLLHAEVDVPKGMYGRPLFTRTWEEQRSYWREHYVIQSSYFPVFGILDENGTKLYVDNANTGERTFYHLQNDPAATTNLLNDHERKKYQSMIRSYLNEVNQWYFVRNADTGFWNWWLRN